MKNEKNYVGFLIPKVWQILKHFVGAFHQAQTSYFWRVISYVKSFDFSINFFSYQHHDHNHNYDNIDYYCYFNNDDHNYYNASW